jgi:hypothetical protein
MKKLITLSALTLLVVSTQAQGLVTFQNRDAANGILARVSDVGGAFLDGAAGRIALLGGPTSAQEAVIVAGSATASKVGTLTQLVSPNTGAGSVPFRTGSTLAGYANVGSDSTRVLVGVGFGAQAKLQLVAWTGASTDWSSAFSAAAADGSLHVGASAPWTVTTGADPTVFPPLNTGMAGFSLASIATVPEPSTMALAGLAGASLLIFRRRK